MIATRENYDQREADTRASRQEPYSLFMLNPSAGEVLRSYTTVAEFSGVTGVRCDRRGNGVLLTWSFAIVGSCAAYHDRQHKRARPRRAQLVTGFCAYCTKKLEDMRADAVFCDKVCRQAEWTGRNRDVLKDQQRARNERRKAERARVDTVNTSV